MQIKIVDINDLDDFYKLNKLYGNNKTKEELEKHINNNNEIICIAYIRNIPAGFIIGSIKESINRHPKIKTFFVRDDYRRKGVAMELLKFLENEMNSKLDVPLKENICGQ